MGSILTSAAAYLAPFGWREATALLNVDDEHDKLKRTSSKIQTWVDRVDRRPRIYLENNAMHLLFTKLRKLDYEANALLDHIRLRLNSYNARHSITSDENGQLSRMVLSSPREFTLPHKIVEMRKKLDEVAKEMDSLIDIERIAFNYNTIPSSYIVNQSYSSFRPNEMHSIVSLLNGPTTNTTVNFSVISIVGMAGIGKTTLAQFAYCRINFDSFDKKIWVSLSAGFDAIMIMRYIIEFATGSPCNLSDLASLQRKLLDQLNGRKFLIVLDNYWSENCDDWDTLSMLFQYGSQGSKVIVTTRNMDVSLIVDSNEEYTLETLSDDDCWQIIQQSARMRVVPDWNLESVGMQIANKCKGVPLVAHTLGNMLRGKSTEEEWRLVLERDMWDMLQDDNNILRHLMQSYVQLRTPLRKCFAYCSIFPQGYEFEMEELISLWIAEGYVQSSTDQESQGKARRYFEDLCSRFFFYKCRPASNRDQIRYKMHDLIHGMAQLVSKDICFHIEHDESNCYLFGDACHLSLLHDGIQPLQLEASVKNERLRTFLVMNNAGATTMLHPQLFSYLKYLRVLGLGGARLTELVDSIELLESLRYLNLTDNPISYLPKSVCKIEALQILKLRSCPNLHDFPEEMSSLINLRHLEFDERMLTLMPPQFRKLVKLQYLSAYTVGEKNGCGIGELKSLNCLGGRLYIRKIEVSNTSEAREAELDLKRHLYKLELEWTKMDQLITDQDLQQISRQEDVFVELRPHKNLKELVITNYFGMTCPPWLSYASNNFTKIDLNGLKHCSHLPSLGELPYLQNFSISNMPRLGSITPRFYGANNQVKFRSLLSFQLRGLSELKDWEEANENDVMPLLHHFTIHYCQKLSRLPKRVRELRPSSTVTGCPRLPP